MWCANAHFFLKYLDLPQGIFTLTSNVAKEKGYIECIRTTQPIRLVSIPLVRLVQVEKLAYDKAQHHSQKVGTLLKCHYMLGRPCAFGRIHNSYYTVTRTFAPPKHLHPCPSLYQIQLSAIKVPIPCNVNLYPILIDKPQPIRSLGF